MVVFNPCCCISLQRGSKTVAIVDIILALLPLIVFISTYIPGAYGPQGQPFSDFNMGIWTIFIVFLTADIGLSLLLFCAAKMRCIKNMKRWFYIRLVTTGSMVLLIIISSCFEVSLHLILYDLLYTIYRLYSLWVVYLHIGELVHEDTFTSRKQPHPDFSVAVIGGHGYSKTLPTYEYGSEWDRDRENTNPKYGTVNGAYIH